jgi:hypothetical protein
MSDVICTSKSRQLLGQLSFFYSNKKKVRGGEREREYNESMWERVVQSCPFFGCTNIIIVCINI